MTKTIQYFRNRLEERSTWAAIMLGVTGAAALAAPWSYVAAAIGIVGALCPSPSGPT